VPDNELAARIDAFLLAHGRRTSHNVTIWKTLDAAELEGASSRLKLGREIRRVPWSEWESGGYMPYTSKDARAEHDEIIRLIADRGY